MWYMYDIVAVTFFHWLRTTHTQEYKTKITHDYLKRISRAVNLGYVGFADLCSLVGPENSRHFLNQSNSRLEPIATWLLAFFPRFR